MITLSPKLDVAVVSSDSRYPKASPFHPSLIYPEYPYHSTHTDSDNHAYGSVRASLRLLDMDKTRFGTPDWNPLGELISSGQRVLVKPNFVLHFNAGTGPLEAVITHPSVIRAVCDYVIIALGNGGELIVGDAPQMNCDFAELCRKSGMDTLASFLEAECARRSIAFRLVDFRQEQTSYKHGIVWDRKLLNGSESVSVNIGSQSFMEAIDSKRLYGADYCRRETIHAHENNRHEYLVAREVLSSNVVVSVPKLKVHRKVGTTLNLKNIVGINTDKNHLAHYRIGSPESGGDEFSDPNWQDRVERVLSDRLLGSNRQLGKYLFLTWRAFRKALALLNGNSPSTSFAYGNWHGNDTAWRMVLDLNRILLFADAEGRLQTRPVRNYFSVIDGIIGGEGEGPLHPSAYPAGVVLAGYNPLAVDCVATRLMGFDVSKIPLYRNALEGPDAWASDFAIEHIRVISNDARFETIMKTGEPVFHFRAPAGWRGQIELQQPSADPLEQEEAFVGMISQ